MRLLLVLLSLIIATSIVSAYQLNTTSYTVEKTNTGIQGNTGETSSYNLRFYFNPYAPSSEGSTSLYYLHTGYFNVITSNPQDTTITLLNPTSGEVLNDANITFSHSAVSNGTIDSCNLLAYYNTSILTINETVLFPGQGNYTWTSSYPLSEDTYDWKVECQVDGNTSSSTTSQFIVDRTSPNVTINKPTDNTTEWEEFEITIEEENPATLTISINGSNYTYNYTNGTNTYQPSLPLGVYTYNLTVYDAAGNNETLNNQPIYVIDVPITFQNPQFSPNPPLDGIENTLSVKIGGSFTDVTLSININNTGWTNYTINTYTGSGPYTYYYDLSPSQFSIGDQIKQQWHATDNINQTRTSSISTATVRKRLTGGGGGGFPRDEEEPTAEAQDSLNIKPSLLQIRNTRGVLFDVHNNGSKPCTLTNIIIEPRIGSPDLQDAFTTKNLNPEGNITVEPNKTLAFQIKPRSLQGIAGSGELTVESNNCKPTNADLSVNINIIDVSINWFNEVTQNIIRFTRGLFT